MIRFQAPAPACIDEDLGDTTWFAGFRRALGNRASGQGPVAFHRSGIDQAQIGSRGTSTKTRMTQFFGLAGMGMVLEAPHNGLVPTPIRNQPKGLFG